ncbi:LysR family transcriptional regulator [Aquabacterium sp. J223]|uniref:LysR family transcriptional regulator n=1 Tax=Aquabacterium sp. J223 TaxID=2898431 RepID=UPI0021AE1400|nr:LysR family transcriptional regulator [Aquabacterium sp. J223]UUX96706.1 LysR family transcriptional regulator [Aquabacterium sp. J223]
MGDAGVASRLDHLVRRLRLRHLELLVKLGGVATLRGVAEQLNLSQPAISKMLVEIEDAFGSRLFERSRQGVRPNASGEAAIHHARLVLGELSRATDALEAMRNGASALLRLGTLPVTATVPAAIVDLRARLPGVTVQIREGRVQELMRRLVDGELDCVFGAVTPEGLASDSLDDIEAEVIVQDGLCVLASAAHEPVRPGPLHWRDLAGGRWVAPPRETLVRQAFMTAFLDEGLAPPVPVIETMSSVTIGAVMRLDPALLCAVRREHALDELARGGVRELPVLPSVGLPPLCLFTRRGDIDRPAVVDAFAQALRRSAGDRRRTV